MKIAFISYEYPPDTADGGIATYVYQASRMLAQRGHQVEVFAGSRDRAGTTSTDGIIVHRVKVDDYKAFADPVGKIFANRHAVVAFDLLEGPDFGADAREAVRRVPDIPLVLKLHTPSRILLQLNYYEANAPWLTKVYLYLASLLKGVRPAWGYAPAGAAYRRQALKADKIEHRHALQADEIASPSRALGKWLVQDWGLDASKVHLVPYPYIPAKNLLQIPAETQTNRVTFIGRLEIRKGILDLAHAIPHVLQHVPDVKFRLVGAAEPSPNPRLDMRQYLEKLLKPHAESIEFTGAVAPELIHEILATTDVCVFPSLWENFPCVCLEAMAAARGIIGTDAGGMADMLETSQAGYLIPPHSPDKIAQALIELLTLPSKRIQLGQAARSRLLSEYSADRIVTLQEESYLRAIKRRQGEGAGSREILNM
jgi:glycosyltransferase involved in cell wall biosynthesis